MKLRERSRRKSDEWASAPKGGGLHGWRLRSSSSPSKEQDDLAMLVVSKTSCRERRRRKSDEWASAPKGGGLHGWRLRSSSPPSKEQDDLAMNGLLPPKAGGSMDGGCDLQVLRRKSK